MASTCRIILSSTKISLQGTLKIGFKAKDLMAPSLEAKSSDVQTEQDSPRDISSPEPPWGFVSRDWFTNESRAQSAYNPRESVAIAGHKQPSKRPHLISVLGARKLVRDEL